MKKWRFAGFDDGFSGFEDHKAYIVACITAGTYVEGFLFSEIDVDGLDATSTIIDLINGSRFRQQLKCIFLSGITFAGFNVADIDHIYHQTNIPVAVIMNNPPDLEAIDNALQNVKQKEKRKEILRKAGDVYSIDGLFVQLAGCSLEEVKEFIQSSTIKGKRPEPVRIPHLVASSLVYGESRKE
ncbi:MAG: DUF99 family protein [Archaeoglobaceae archaeon]